MRIFNALSDTTPPSTQNLRRPRLRSAGALFELPALQSHPLVLAKVLDEFNSAELLSSANLTWILRDPGLTATFIDETKEFPDLASVDKLLEHLKNSDFRLRILNIAVAALGLPLPASQTEAWEYSIKCALLCQSLAQRIGHAEDDAYLAGLLHNLESYAVDIQANRAPSNIDRSSGKWASCWSNWQNLAIALDAQHVPREVMRDALPLAKLLRISKAIVYGEPEMHSLALDLLPELTPDTLESVRNQADKTLDGIKQALGLSGERSILSDQSQSGRQRLATAMENHLLYAKAAELLSQAENIEQATGAACTFLNDHLRISSPFFLNLDKSANTLAPAPNQPSAYSGLHISIKESNSAAAWAATSRMPVLFSALNPDSVSLLDHQLAMQSGCSSVVALPVGEFEITGIMLGCVSERQSVVLEQNIAFLAQLGRLMGKAINATQFSSRKEHKNQGKEISLSYQERIRRTIHEVNNPLGIVKNYLALLRDKLAANSDGLDEIRVINEELNRIPDILQRLGKDEGLGQALSEFVDLGTVLNDMAVIAESAIPKDKQLEIVLKSEANLPRVRSNIKLLKQLLLNLVLNALEAAPDYGSVVLELGRSIDLGMESRIVISIRDSGPGIPPEKLAQIFEPTETTKGGEHAGLGLSIVKSLAADLGVSVTCQSSTNGTVFNIFFKL